jgi:leucyl-tRNA synthetase
MKEYQHQEVEQKWRKHWEDQQTFKSTENSNQPKFYALDMFPYPSGAGLHVGHPLGYIASDIFSRYKRHLGYNVLHPMGFDSFGLPAEQYAIQTGQHPAITTDKNITRYKEQLSQLGFNYDWSREVRTSDPSYYRWTQWIFKQLFNSWYNLDSDKAEDISTLVEKFNNNGTYNVNAHIDENWHKSLPKNEFPLFGQYFSGEFTATDWQSLTPKQQSLILMHFRLAYLADSVVNWCPALGTVLANDEIKDGVSERGGHPVEQKLMRQWSMRISAYAQRLLDGLNTIDWSEPVKEMQRNWIGKSVGASVHFEVENFNEKIEVFTTRPDTIFGASFMVLAPEHPLVEKITTEEYRNKINSYVEAAALKTERDRQSNVKTVSGQFTGAYALNPFNGKQIPIWIGEYVLASYGTGAIMAVPAGDQRDWDFAKKFDLEIPNIFANADISEAACSNYDVVIANSDFLNGLNSKEATKLCISKLEEMGIGKGKTNFRLRDAVFSRQRYWGEPFPVYYKNDLPHLIKDASLPVELPEVDKYLPTESGEPPLARAKKEAWNVFEGDRMEYNTMPGWAGSSWYFLRYMDPNNTAIFADRAKIDYWNQVDLYIGGAEHATGHLLYSRFWTKFLFDRGHIGFDEPFKKMINQGMILGRSSFVYRVKNENVFVSFDKKEKFEMQQLHVDISLVENDKLSIEKFKQSRAEYKDARFILSDDGQYHCGHEVEKMSKSKFNVQTPDELVEKFGADTLRMYEMFLGPLEQSKPWDTNGINGVHNFLRKLWRLVHDEGGNFAVSAENPSKEELKTLHKTIKKITEDLERYSFNTVVSALMICVNELIDLKCKKRAIIEPLAVLLSPYAPHFAEELWEKLGHDASIYTAKWPVFNADYLVESTFSYPVSFNGKMRFTLELALDLDKTAIEKAVLNHELSAKYLDGNTPKKVIVVPGRIVNIVI